MLIIGAGGHAKEVLDIVSEKVDKSRIYFYDDTNGAAKQVNDFFKVVHNEDGVVKLFNRDCSYYLGVGNPILRDKLSNKMQRLGGSLKQVFAKTAIISKYSIVNSDVMHDVFVGSNVIVGKGGLLNYGVQLHHDVRVEEFVELSPSAVILGGVAIGSYSSIGANATILPKIKIGTNCIVGAGAVVTKDIPDNTMVAGVPARVIKKL